MEQKNYTLKECRAFNQKQLEITTAFARGNFANAECKELVLPDEVQPWNILHSVIAQFYKREYEMAQAIDMSRCEMNRAKKMIEDAKERNDLYWRMQKEIGDLKQENKRLQEELSQSEENLQEQPKALQELLLEASLTEWVDGMGEVLDSLIMAIDCTGSDGLTGSLRYTRSLQQFFIELEKEAN